MPAPLEAGKLYIAPKFRAAMHLCACGCGVPISTPLHPTGWRISYDGVKLSMSPSVGNWGEECQSHYWIEDNRVMWARKWSRREIDAERRRRAADIADYFAPPRSRSFRERIRRWLRRAAPR